MLLCSILTSAGFQVVLRLVKVARLVTAEVKMGNWKEAIKAMGRKKAIDRRRRRRMRQLGIGKGQR